MAIICAPLALASSSCRIRIARFWSQITLKLAHKIAGLDFELRGQLPSGPCLIAARHESVFETLAFMILLDNPAFVLKKGLLAIPFFGCYLAGANMIAINRRHGVRALKLMVAKAQSAIAAGRPVVIFPESTRVSPGCFPRLQSGIVALYEGLGLAIIPVALNSGLYWQPGLAGPRPGQIILEVMPPIPPGLTRSDVMTRLAHSLREGSTRLEKQARNSDTIQTSLR